MDLRKFGKAREYVRGVTTLRPRFTPGHFYSPITTPADAERAIGWKNDIDIPIGVNIDLAAMRDLAVELAPMWRELPVTERYHPDEMYCHADAAVLHSVLRRYRPSLFLEVGSGFSTAVVLDAIEAHQLNTKVTCIEPYPARLQSLIRPDDSVTLHEALVQDVPVELFDDLAPGDVLFIDSTHVGKAGSDVLWLLLRVLPRIPAGVLVHVHDVFWPLEYKDSWLRSRMDWNEIYLLHAFLSGNPSWRVLHFNDWVWQHCPDVVTENAEATSGERPGGIWLEKLS